MQITVAGQTFQIDDGTLLTFLTHNGIQLNNRTQVREVTDVNSPDRGKVLLNEAALNHILR